MLFVWRNVQLIVSELRTEGRNDNLGSERGTTYKMEIR